MLLYNIITLGNIYGVYACTFITSLCGQSSLLRCSMIRYFLLKVKELLLVFQEHHLHKLPLVLVLVSNNCISSL